MSATAAQQPAQAQAPAAAAAPPIMAPLLDSGATDHGPLGSLSQIPVSAPSAPAPVDASAASDGAIQRKCEACEQEERDDTTKVRPKLEVGAADDPFEREADTIAGHVMAISDADLAPQSLIAGAAHPAIQRACSACSASSDDELRARRAPSGLSLPSADEEEVPRMAPESAQNHGIDLAASASRITSGGSPLSDHVRTFFEARMGRDLSHVRVHSGGEADAFNRSIGARAFTYENHIWLNRNEQPERTFTMAHELAHVLQQTSPGPVGHDHSSSSQVMARRSVEVTADRSGATRRFVAFWQPLGSQVIGQMGLGPSATGRHNTLHNQAQEAFVNGNSGLVTEVRIPNAGTSSGCGYADLYKSNNGNVPGVEPDGAGGLRNLTTRPVGTASPTSCATTWNFHPMLPRVGAGGAGYHHMHRYPRINAAGAFTHCNRAPSDVWIGDVKPGHNESARRDGEQQVQDYIDGVRTTAGMTPAGCWSVNPRVMQGNQLSIPRNLQPGRTGGWTIPQLELRLSSGFPGASDVYQPMAGPRGGYHSIRGRLSAVKDRRYTRGIWVYFVEPRPSDLQTQFRRQSQQPNFRPAARRLQIILNCLRSHPNRRRSLCRRPDPAAPAALRVRRALPALAQPRTARNRKVVRRRVTDQSFDFSVWNAMRVGSVRHPQHNTTNLRHIVNRDIPQNYRDSIKFQYAVSRAEDWFDTTYGSTNHSTHVPAGTRIQGRRGIRNLSRQVEKFEFWTDDSVTAPAAIFGRMRAMFGTVFVRAVRVYERMRERARQTFRSTRMRGGGRGVIGQIARRVGSAVLMTLGGIMLRKIGTVIQQCLESGFTEYMTSLIEGESLDELRTKFQEAQAIAQNMHDSILDNFEEIAERIIGPLSGWLDEIAGAASIIGDIASFVSNMVRTVRVGLCLAGLSAAGVGVIISCLVSFFDLVLSFFGLSPIDWVVGKLMDNCSTRRAIARLMMSSDFVQRLPTRIAKELIRNLRDELPQEARNVFCDPDSIRVEPITMSEFNCNESSGFGFDSGGSGGGGASGSDAGDGQAARGAGSREEEEERSSDRQSATEDAMGGEEGSGEGNADEEGEREASDDRGEEQEEGVEATDPGEEQGESTSDGGDQGSVTVDLSDLQLSNEDLDTDETATVTIYLRGSIRADHRYDNETVTASLTMRRTNGIVLRASNKRFRITSIDGRPRNSAVRGWPLETITWTYSYTDAEGEEQRVSNSISSSRDRPYAFNVRRDEE